MKSRQRAVSLHIIHAKGHASWRTFHSSFASRHLDFSESDQIAELLRQGRRHPSPAGPGRNWPITTSHAFPGYYCDPKLVSVLILLPTLEIRRRNLILGDGCRVVLVGCGVQLGCVSVGPVVVYPEEGLDSGEGVLRESTFCLVI